MATGRIGATPTLRTRWSKLPTTGTTVLSGLDDNSVALVYDAGYEAVYRNGVLLSRGNDYTATNGTTVTLIDATLAGDVIEIFANDLVPLTDAISKGQYNAKGALLSATAASTPAVLAVGTNGQVLTADSTAGTGLAWASASAAGRNYTLLSTVTANSATTLSFTGLSGKDSYVLMWQGVSFSAFGNDFVIRVNNSSSAIYNYARVGKDNNNPGGSATDTSFRICYTQTSSIPTNGSAFFEGANGAGGKTIEAIANVADFVTGSTQVPIAVQGIANLGATITSINLLFGSATFTAGTFYLWGA